MTTKEYNYTANNYIEAGKVITKLRLVEKLNNNFGVPLSAIKCNVDYLRDALESKHNIITVISDNRLKKWSC